MKTMMVAGLGALVLLGGCTVTTDIDLRDSVSPVAADASRFEADRAAILAMQGEYQVTFDFRETVAVAPGYELAEPKLTPAREIVIVVEDTGDTIMLQHLLVVGSAEDPFIVKHWRQDWRYQPASLLAFQGHDDWVIDSVSAEDRSGAWSQTVYQVDDSPRYAGLARWTHDDNGISTWEPAVSLRPLPRRDDTTRDDYDAIAAVNRHTILDWGWTHEQDNSKIALRDGVTTEIAREIGINTYREAPVEGAQAAYDYWDVTQAYWARVREHFLALETKGQAFHIEDDAEGTLLYGAILDAGQSVLFEQSTTDQAWEDIQPFLESQIQPVD